MYQRLWIIAAVPLLLYARPAVAADTASITAKANDGAYVGLDDGTKWLVEHSDESTVSAWTVGDDIVEVDDSTSCSDTELIDTDESGEEACAHSAQSDTSSITDKSDDGAYLSLDDGTRWLVSDGDQSTSETWLVADDVLHLTGQQACANVEIIDVDEGGDEVCARPIQ